MKLLYNYLEQGTHDYIKNKKHNISYSDFVVIKNIVYEYTIQKPCP